MRILLATIAALGLSISAAEAGCRKETTLDGFIQAKGKQERGFTLSRPGAVISIKTESLKDYLYWRIVRPNGRTVNCNMQGPGAILTCNPSVGGRGKPAGYHKVLLANRLNRAVPYTISCDNPP